jgi:hypothetical protein
MKLHDKSAGAASQPLLAAAREQPPVCYDVERGLARHRQLRLADVPLPGWAEQLARPKAWWHGWLAKSLLAALLLGGGFGAWHRTRALPPAAAARRPPSPATVVQQPGAGATSVQKPQLPILDARALPPIARANKLRRTRLADMRHAVKSDAPPVQREVDSPVAASEPTPSAAATSAQGAQRFEIRPFERPEPPSDAAELQWLARAERSLRDDPAHALKLLREGDARFPEGYFRQERAYLVVMATLALGQLDSAHDHAQRFLQRYPRSPYAERVRGALRSRAANE